jgi:ubiquinone/menaquinone biosynthesis C-methylase UbiE
MERIPEPELMDDPEQGQAYAQADFSEPNKQFVNLFSRKFPNFSGKGKVLDLGCGPADILVRFIHKYPQCHCLGIDGAEAMLAPGREVVTRKKLDHCIQLRCQCLPLGSENGTFSAILSNSLLHHLHQPKALWETIRDCSESSTVVMIMDLFRPESREDAKRIVQMYAGNESSILQVDFYNSLLAAFRVDEVNEQLQQYGLPLKCEQVSDRHLLVWGCL